MPGHRFVRRKSPLSSSVDYFANEVRSKRLELYKKHYGNFKAGRKTTEELAKIKTNLKNPSNATRTVFNISKKQFPLRGAPNKEFVQRILNWMNKNIEYVGESIEFAVLMYGKLNAEDILVKKKIPTILDSNRDPLFGCGQEVDAFIALLKTVRGINNIKHVRVAVPIFFQTTNKLGLVAHSLATFQIHGKGFFLADPFNNGQIFLTSKTLAPLKGELTKKVNILKKLGLWIEGNSLFDFNKSFEGYRKEKNRLATKAKEEKEAILEALK